MLRFVLPRAAHLVFVVEQVAPVCRVVSRFTVKGRAGVNRIRFPRPASRLRLRSGTYVMSGRTRTGRLVERVILAVFEQAPSAAELQNARSANVCATSFGAATFGSTGAHVERVLSPAGTPSASGPVLSPGSGSQPGGVLGSTAARAARAIRPILIVLLGLAIVLLGVASLPRLSFVDRRANDLLAQHRLEIVALGAAAFIAVLITFLLG